ncbi:hypothetical protein QJS04_geneDACA019248 [Acorus gramineus]|uniref:Uncharacterized protein n=1 Tax=Acorus gramineus TaxID=55184 RepID=A0AAV8ZXY6_ACOGR|nr:hypothetical protein QJS04_geneDACA019248 [Acorus gramineus]
MCSPSSSSSSRHSNLQCFLDCTTPTVRSHLLPKTCFRDPKDPWRLLDKEPVEYFTLKDLWDSYDEWSAYGVGVPVLLKSGESVVQYYVPYLSAIQIYTNNSVAIPRSTSEDSESEKLSRSLSNDSNRSWDATSEDSSSGQEGYSLVRGHRHGHLYLEYEETLSPFLRTTFMHKVNKLAQDYPGMMTFKSVDLSPLSWMAVAWYPIYQIPTIRYVRDLSTGFLTFHKLSLSVQDTDTISTGEGEHVHASHAWVSRGDCKGDGTRSISLPPFGLETYKMQGTLWMNPETADKDRMASLRKAAASWLKQLKARHHDFSYFNTRS